MAPDAEHPTPDSPLQRGIENSVRLAMIMLSVPFMVITDLVVVGNRLGERSVIEWSQALVLLVTTVLFAGAARRRSDGRGFYLLVSGFFACCFIREMDLMLDQWFFHGAWAYLSGGAAAVAIVLALRVRRTLRPGAVGFVNTRAFIYVQIGLVVVVILSRSLGSGRQLWFLLGQDDSYRLCKTVIQEALESFGYLLICFGAIMLHREIDSRVVPGPAAGRC